MTSQEMLLRLNLISQLQEQQEELEAQIEALKDSVKAEMREQGIEKMSVGRYKVSWVHYITHRFDTKMFRADHEDLYTEYTKATGAQRFSVTTAKESN